MKNTPTKPIAAVLCALILSSVALAASINPPTTPQTSPAMNDKEKANLKLVLDWWREVIEGGHMELTTKYQAEDYIQHNPNVPTGRAAFVSFFQNVVGVKPKNPIPATLRSARPSSAARRATSCS